MYTFVYVCIYIYTYVSIYQKQRTPLHLAVIFGHGEIVETLVKAKADLCAQDRVSVLKGLGCMLS